MQSTDLLKLAESIERLGGFPIGKTIVLSEENDGSGPERVIAQTRELSLEISYQHKAEEHEDWKTWQDSGVSLSWAEFRTLLKGLLL
jgi:hypothetical protein